MKTEKQKAAEGLLYDANNDPELQQEMLQTRCLLHEYNLLPPDRTDERDRLIRRIVHMGEGGGYHIRIGRNFFANTNLVILDGADVTIGDNVFIAPHVGIYTAGHPLDIGRRNAGLEYAYPICIGNNVWIGGNVVILPGVTIGDGAVIGAGSVVTRDVPAHTLAVGNPCRPLRKIDEEDSENSCRPR